MVTYHKGDLLKSGCNIICHQVNLQGVMGGGLALQIARQHPDCERVYKEYIQNTENVFGKVFLWVKNGISIANCFSQKEDFTTDYEAVKKCFTTIAQIVQKTGLSVGLPYKYGCGIAKGEWRKVEQIILEVFGNTEIDCQIWQL